jgi:hypothetical protein
MHSVKTTFALVCTLSLPFSLLGMSSAHALEPFQATYSFNINGLLSGPASRTLEQHDGVWSYTFTAAVPMLASASEVSHFRMPVTAGVDGRIESLDHAYNFKFLANSKNSGFKVNWDTKTVTGSNKNGEVSYPAQEGMLDMLDLELQVREDLKHNHLRDSYLLADDKGIKTISFVNEGAEKISTPAGSFDTIKLRLAQEGEKRKTFFWLAKSLDYLPVRVHQDDGNLSYDISLTNYQEKK